MLIMYDEPFAGLDLISLNVIAQLIRKLNDVLGATRIVVTYDVSESLKVVAYALFIDRRVIVAGGPARTIPSCASSCTPKPTARLPSTCRPSPTM